MNSLELKVPPPAIAVLVAAAMWALSRVTPSVQIPSGIRLFLALAVAIVAIGFSVGGIISFLRARPNEAAIGILPGELWHLRSHPEPDVCRLAARSHCIGDLSFLALDVGRAGGILSLHRAFSNRTRGARAHRFIRHQVHGVSIQGSPVALRPNTATAHADAGRRRFAS